MSRARPSPLDVAVSLLTVAAVAHYGWGVFSPPIGAAAAAGYNILFGVGAITCLATASRLRAADRAAAARTWQLLAAGLVCILVAQSIIILVDGPLAEPLSDLAALLFYPLVGLGFWREIPRPATRPARGAARLDLALVFVTSVTVLVALLVRNADELSWSLVPSAAYRAVSPAMALVAVAAVARWYATAAAAHRTALALAAFACVGVAIGDLLLNVFPEEWNRWSNVAWAIGVWFLIVGAQRAPTDHAPAAANARGAVFATAIPFAAAAALVLTLLTALLPSRRPEMVFLAAGGFVIVLLLLARHLLALRAASVLERARAEQEARLRESERLDALGRMARGVAHDFNGMLTAILGNAELALDTPPAEADARESLERIREVALTATGITRQLLDFARSGAIEPIVVDVAAVLRTQCRILASTLPAGIVLDVKADDGPLRVRLGAGFVEQVLHNLVSNARDAMLEGGTLRIQVRGSATSVTLTVADSGTGMDEAMRQRIFEPFFSTKGPRGTGLGLATVYGIVRQGGGEIRVESAPGRGTTFSLQFPRMD